MFLSQVCESSPQFLSVSNRLGDENTQLIDVGSRNFIEYHLRFFPCPPPDLSTSFCSNLLSQSRIRLSCLETTIVLELCLEQVDENTIVYMIADCEKHLHCSEFKNLCYSGKFSAYCDRQAPSFTYARNNEKILMNNTTGIMTVEAESSDLVTYYAGPTNWHILWVLLILIYIFVFVPCFLNFVLKR